MEPGGENWIETLPRRGYRYVGPAVANELPSEGAAANTQPPAVLAVPDNPSLAVLPFTNMSGDPQQEYFADGVVEDIITGLARIKWLFVVARNSSFIYKGQSVSVKKVGRELGVRYVLEGSARKRDPVCASPANWSRPKPEFTMGRTICRPLDDFCPSRRNHLERRRCDRTELDVKRRSSVSTQKAEKPHAYDLVLRALPHVSGRRRQRRRRPTAS